MASADLKDELTCSICLTIYSDPVTLRCGHNFCRDCIARALDTRMDCEAYTCPECRARFRERPVLQRNTTLCNIAEHFLSQEEREEVLCTYCVHTTVVASKTCLMCEASLCDLHLTVHSMSPEHVLIQPTRSFRIRKCSHHKKAFMYYCTEDEECLCAFCCLGEDHRGHQVEFLLEAVIKKQEKLRIVQGDILKEREKIENRVNLLQDHLKQIPGKAADIVERVNVEFRDIRMKQNSLERRVLNEISEQQEQVSLSVSDLIQQLEIKKDDMSRKLTTIEELCQMTDPLLYLQADREDFTDVTGDSNANLNETEPDDLPEDLMIKTLISGVMSIALGLQKGYYVQEATGIKWDVNTAANDVHVSDDFKTASWSKANMARPEIPERFEYHRVLSKKGFSSGRLYWDIEVSREGNWRVGMTYPSIDRKGEYSHVGTNKKSWGLRRLHNRYSIRYSEKETQLSCRPSCYKVRIYLDYEAGLLSFYEMSNSMRHLHTLNATFTEALYPVIGVWEKGWVRILN